MHNQIKYKNFIEFVLTNPAAKKDPRIYSLYKHFKDTNFSPEKSALSKEDINAIFDFTWKIIGLSIPDNSFEDPIKRDTIQIMSILVMDVLEDFIKQLKSQHPFLYSSIKRVRIGGNLISTSIMGRDYDPDVLGDFCIRLLYKYYFYTRISFALLPYNKEKYLLLHQDGIRIFKRYEQTIDNISIYKVPSGAIYITGIEPGDYTVVSRLKEDGRIQINYSKSKK